MLCKWDFERLKRDKIAYCHKQGLHSPRYSPIILHTSQAVAGQLREYAQISPSEAMLMEEYVTIKTEE